MLLLLLLCVCESDDWTDHDRKSPRKRSITTCQPRASYTLNDIYKTQTQEKGKGKGKGKGRQTGDGDFDGKHAFI